MSEFLVVIGGCVHGSKVISHESKYVQTFSKISVIRVAASTMIGCPIEFPSSFLVG